MADRHARRRHRTHPHTYTSTRQQLTTADGDNGDNGDNGYMLSMFVVLNNPGRRSVLRRE